MSLTTYGTPVREDWVDYNGHLSEAYYVLVFGFATDAAMDALGLGADYRQESGCSLYTVEAHVRYLQEVGLGAQLSVRTHVVGVAEKKLHLAHEMYVGDQLVATEEILGIHVDQADGRATVLPEATRTSAAERRVEPPAWVGRAVRI
ncbi:MAG: thioesterase family protein [Brevibacterium yomogidense]